MTINEAGLGIIKRRETLRLVAYAATEAERARGIWSIGWGHTRGVKEGDTCTPEWAEARLHEDIIHATFEAQWLVRAPLTENQWSALISLIYNVGTGKSRINATSGIIQKINARDFQGAAEEFLRWNHQDGKVVDGLTKRRQEEHDLFLKP